jgi:hypothetical protein
LVAISAHYDFATKRLTHRSLKTNFKVANNGRRGSGRETRAASFFVSSFWLGADLSRREWSKKNKHFHNTVEKAPVRHRVAKVLKYKKVI